jgi:hypothetical protein
MSDGVGQNDELALGVEELAGTEKHAGKVRPGELLSRTAGAVQHYHGVEDAAGSVCLWLAVGHVVQVQLGQDFSGVKMEVAKDKVAFNRPERLLGGDRCHQQTQNRRQEQEDAARTRFHEPELTRKDN